MKLRRRKGMNRILMSIMIMAMSTLLFSACNDDDEPNVEPVEVAYVSLYQASPNAPDLSIMADGRQVNTYPFDYADYTGYLRFYTGNRNLQISPYDANNVVADTLVDFEANHSYSVFTVGDYQNMHVLTMQDDNMTPATGNAMIRFINLSPDAPALNLMATDKESPIAEDQQFMENATFQELDADNYDFQIVSTSNENAVELNVPDITLQSGFYYTIIVRGYDTPPAGNEHVLSAEVLVN